MRLPRHSQPSLPTSSIHPVLLHLRRSCRTCFMRVGMWLSDLRLFFTAGLVSSSFALLGVPFTMERLVPPFGPAGAPYSISSCPAVAVANTPQYPLQDKASVHRGLQQDGCSATRICPRVDERFRGVSSSPCIAPKHDGCR